MSKKFLVSLAERVLTVYVFAFFATYAAGLGGTQTLNHIFYLSLGQKAGAAGIAAVLQLLASVFVGSQVGDPESASLLPSFMLRSATPEQLHTVVVSVDDVVNSALAAINQKYPGVVLSADEIASKVLADALRVAPPSAELPEAQHPSFYA